MSLVRRASLPRGSGAGKSRPRLYSSAENASSHAAGSFVHLAQLLFANSGFEFVVGSLLRRHPQRCLPIGCELIIPMLRPREARIAKVVHVLFH